MVSQISRTLSRFQERAPVKTVRAAKELGINVFKSMTLGADVSGMIVKDSDNGGDSGYAIYVNGTHADVRRRFTIAHELGHFILHRSLIGDGIVEDALLRANGLTNAVERQANAFAADYLMPWALIDQASEEGITSVDELASLFEVSRDAMSYRILGVSYQRAQASGRV